MKASLVRFIRKLANRRAWSYGLFWSWNIIFLAFMFLGFAPQVLPDLIRAVQMGSVPLQYLVYGVVLILIPAVAVILGWTVLRRAPERLLALGYAVEGPLMMMLLVRFFLVRDATLGLNVLFALVALALAAFLWQLFDRSLDRRSGPIIVLRVAGLTLFVLVTLYVAAWLGFYVVPIAAAVLRGLADALLHLPQVLAGIWDGLVDLVTRQPSMILLVLLGVALFLYTSTLLILMPIAVPVLALWGWRRALRVLNARYGPLYAVLTAGSTIVVTVLLFAWANQQPQQLAFNLLDKPPATLSEAQALLGKQDVIRAGLLNAYLAPQRYLSVVGDVRHVSDMYQQNLGLSKEQAAGVEQAYEALAAPLLYTPVHPPTARDEQQNRALTEEPRQAAELYQNFFDTTIVKGEHAAVVNAVRSTWSGDQSLAAVQSVENRLVHLNRQELTVTEHGDWAEFELYEVYQNQTSQRQEVVYYLTLPESAVITGLWLGNSEDRSVRFAYQVAPRGAAQAVYRNEVRRNVDPALIEQIGPRQYRLRIFPVQPQVWTFSAARSQGTALPGSPLYLWLTWRALAQNASWTLPYLSDKRNVFWDGSTVHLLNGKPMPASGDAWLPSSVAASAQPAAHRFDGPNGQTVIARPLPAAALPALPPNARLAVVVDRSRSMEAHAAEVQAALTAIGQAANTSQVQVYLTSSSYRGEGASRVAMSQLDPGKLTYIGGQKAADLFTQFSSLYQGEPYDGVLVLTDGSGYEPGPSANKPRLPGAPIWMVHLGGEFPMGYDDAALEAVQSSGGGVTGNVQDALARLAVRLRVAQAGGWQGVPSNAVVDYADGYLWITLPTKDASLLSDAGASDPAWGALGARRLVLTTMQQARGALSEVATLDKLQALARQQSIVTPYSSMIVLVNAAQQQLLDKAEGQADRFQREFEDVGTTVPQMLPITGAPEPEEWLLMAVAGVLLVWYAAKRRILGRFGN